VRRSSPASVGPAGAGGGGRGAGQGRPARSGRHRGRSIANPGDQAYALAEVARALVERGDTRQAHCLASPACAVGQWTTVLELMLSLEPRALAELADL
jgi:hypothetical protein